MDYEKILFADNKLEEDFEAKQQQETLEETCHLDYGYVLNESIRFTENTPGAFASRLNTILRVNPNADENLLVGVINAIKNQDDENYERISKNQNGANPGKGMLIDGVPTNDPEEVFARILQTVPHSNSKSYDYLREHWEELGPVVHRACEIYMGVNTNQSSKPESVCQTEFKGSEGNKTNHYKSRLLR